jgi:CBS domain-containing protein
MSVHDLVFDHIMPGEERAFPVMDGANLVGMVYAEDVRKVDRNKWDKTFVRDVMMPESNLEELSPREDAMEAFQKMASKEMRQMPVVQNGHLVGVLRRRDILRWLQVQSDMGRGGD